LALLEEPWLAGNKIIILEPRRLAARILFSRLAFLLAEDWGKRWATASASRTALRRKSIRL